MRRSFVYHSAHCTACIEPGTIHAFVYFPRYQRPEILLDCFMFGIGFRRCCCHGLHWFAAVRQVAIESMPFRRRTNRWMAYTCNRHNLPSRLRRAPDGRYYTLVPLSCHRLVSWGHPRYSRDDGPCVRKYYQRLQLRRTDEETSDGEEGKEAGCIT